jgi:small neutral amino acid transporter SnatA (MarC family)
MSILFAVLILLGHILVSGLTVLMLRIIASWGGPISNLFGKFGAESFARFMGLVLIPISLWVTTNSILALFSIGVF